ncbi:hypothetical protein HBI60_236280 [Parastagonospora nodorum]|nr:hypothetical protein HBI60_236280 [Parastagonospora nodorum]
MKIRCRRVCDMVVDDGKGREQSHSAAAPLKRPKYLTPVLEVGRRGSIASSLLSLPFHPSPTSACDDEDGKGH